MKKSLLALAFGTFGLGMAEFVMMGILPDIASGLHVSIPRAGHLISAYALGVCAGGPLTVFAARTRPLKQILYGLAALIIAGNLCAALAPDYGVLLVMRFVSGLPHGSFFGVGSIVAERVADKGKSTSAVAFMIAGMTVANLFGVPIGTLIGNLLSWRFTFCLVSVWGVAIVYAIQRWVPVLPALPDNGLKGEFAFLKKRGPWLIFFATMLGNGGMFCWYSYINPLLTQVSGFRPADMSLLMVLSGAGMVIGNLAGGRLSDRFTPERVAAFTQLFMCIFLGGIFFFAHWGWLTVVLTMGCTAALFAVSSPEQLLMLENSRGGELLGAALVQVAFNLGNALGAYCGSLPVRAGLGYRYPALIGIPFAFTGFLLLLHYAGRFSSRRPSSGNWM